MFMCWVMSMIREMKCFITRNQKMMGVRIETDMFHMLKYIMAKYVSYAETPYRFLYIC